MKKKITEIYDYDRTQWEEVIDRWIFNEEWRKMLKRNLLDGIHYERLAEEFDCSRDKVARLIPKLIKRIESKL